MRDPRLLDLLRQAIERTVERGGLYRDIRTGISRGCPLSQLLGALYLKRLDDRMTRSGLFYVRYMDDILVLAKTRAGSCAAQCVCSTSVLTNSRSREPPTKPSSGVSNAVLTFSGIPSAAGPYG
ncbi:MAG: reverse transcriptase domain-containing protein [Burkholderiaceae bacterium]|nr:reverse transcriptase domain-containing protein [Burkholderiaceae bacterium]MDH3460800.1 reverse transcriptase domain-containing protein [Burkholderiaceae bacterium]